MSNMVSWSVKDDRSNKHRTTLSVRLRYLFLFAVITGSIFLLLTIVNGNNDFINTNKLPEYNDIQQISDVSDSSIEETDEEDDGYTIRTAGCTIPALRPFDETVKPFINKRRPEPCNDSYTSIISSNKTHIWIEKTIFIFHNISIDSDLSCCYKAFYRPVAFNLTSSDEDNRVAYQTCIRFYDVIKATDEFVKIECFISEEIVHNSFHLFAIDKSTSEQKKTEKSDYNIILLGIDNVSRLNFHRTMPKTLAFLKEKGVIELKGYNKVGDNSFPNLIPMLLGIKYDNIKNMCYLKRFKTFDNCPFVWELFKEAGYYTALGEDSAFLGTFNYGHHGFYGKPTDYYLRTFMYEAEHKVGSNYDFNSYLCLGEKYSYSILLDYIEHLTSTLRSSKLFGFFWEVTMSHDYLNYPNVMDEKYEDLLNNLKNSAYLDNTILIVLSDHGIRWGDIRKTKQGRLEERLPMFNMLLPRSFQNRYKKAYQNLLMNKNRLTTPFDIHATLTDLSNLDTITNENIIARSGRDYQDSKSISLFLEVPLNRTCEMAAIDSHWCTCHQEHHHSIHSPQAQELAYEMIEHLNDLLQNNPECAKLSIYKVIDVIEMTEGEVEKKAEVSWQEFMIVIRTTPGDGIFEGTYRRKMERGSREGEWELSGTLSRLNMYSTQSHCIDDFRLKLYCYCRDLEI